MKKSIFKLATLIATLIVAASIIAPIQQVEAKKSKTKEERHKKRYEKKKKYKKKDRTPITYTPPTFVPPTFVPPTETPPVNEITLMDVCQQDYETEYQYYNQNGYLFPALIAYRSLVSACRFYIDEPTDFRHSDLLPRYGLYGRLNEAIRDDTCERQILGGNLRYEFCIGWYEEQPLGIQCEISYERALQLTNDVLVAISFLSDECLRHFRLKID